MILTSERIDGTKAAEWGLVHEVVEGEGELDAAVDRWTERILSLPAMSVQMSKYQMRGYSQMSRMGDLSEFDGDASARAIRTADAQGRFGNFGSD
jgi:enoyl-CoA hydratase/carnithine racemase|tara:strand:- start:75 stop:359 length:285 start_codon:yes stop_codon:yes gene_type:complete